MSIGEDRVRVSFNPSGDDVVNKIKHLSADLIDLCYDQMVLAKDDEIKRCLSLAMTHYENAAMWAVKAVTGNVQRR